MKGDSVFKDIYKAADRCGSFDQTVIELDGKIYFVNPTTAKIGSPVASVSPIVHRVTKPRKFTKDEMREVIAGGDDEKHNALVLDIEGYFRLFGFDEVYSEDDRRRDHIVAVMYEVFCAGNEYVGIEAVQDERHSG